MVTKTGTHTLTNKTLASPVFTTQFSIGSAVISEAELETIDGITAGTAAANKALIVDSSIDVAGIRNIGNTGTIITGGIITAAGFTIGSATMVEADLEQVEDITAGTAAANKALVLSLIHI